MEITCPDLRDQALQRAGKGRFTQGTPDFVRRHGPVLRHHSQEARVGEDLGEIREIDIRPGVTLARQSQHGIRPALHATGNHPGEMHAQEREIGIRHRIDEVAAQFRGVGRQFEILTAERHDLCRRFGTRKRSDAIRVQACAVDQVPRFKRPRGGLDRDAIGQVPNGGHARRHHHSTSSLSHQFAQPLANLRVGSDAGFPDVDRFDPAHVGFQFAEAFRPDHLADHAIRLALFVELRKAGQFGFLRCNNHFAAGFVGDSFALAEGFHGSFAVAAVFCFERPRLVIDAGVDDAGVVAGLVLRQNGLFLQNSDAHSWKLLSQLPGGREADNTAADHDGAGVIRHAAEPAS